MKFPRGDPLTSATLLTFLLPFTTAASFDCSSISIDRVLFDLSKLSGPHTVAHSFSQPPSTLNTTYALDICKPLVPDGDNKDERCPGPTQVCAIERLINPIEKTNAISRVIPIAGAFDDEHPLDPVFNMLSAATAEDRLGFRAVLHGGSYAGRSQKAMIDFVCAPDMEGTEGEEKPQDGYKSSAAAAAKREEEKKEEEKEQKKALVFKSYGPDPMGAKDTDTLQVEWHTKYACATEASQASSHWGFFTWFIIMLVPTFNLLIQITPLLTYFSAHSCP